MAVNKRTLISWLLLIVAAPLSLLLLGAAVDDWVRRVVQEEVYKERVIGAHDFALERHRIAAHETAEFVDTHMPQVKAFASTKDLMEHSLRSVGVPAPALYCEFGVYKGETINIIASNTPQTVHGFDSFEGLPGDWQTGFEAGTFRVSGLPVVRANVQLHKGWFDKSIPVWAKEHPGPLAFAHVDCDLYSSTKTVFDLLGDRVVVGTVLQFDEYFNYPGWKGDEYKAFQEFVAQRALKFEYIGYVGGQGRQVAVKILEVGPRKPE